MVNTILKEADLFCPNSVRINFTIYHRQSFPNLMSHQFPTLLQCHFDRLVHIIILVIRRRLHSVPDRPAISYSTSETYTVSCFSI
ncbi:hypothetical protein CNR30_05945 [Levilactobacillus brevis]|nr:hypothetical protein CNR30_05945 [Levilactobacillus brevis]